MRLHKPNRDFTITSLFFLYVGGLLFSWVFLQPPYSLSDEPAHTIKAVATAYGEFGGPQVVGQFNSGATAYQVPEYFTSMFHFVCYNGDVNMPANCIENFSGKEVRVGTSSTAGPYPPTYYTAVGWIGRLLPNESGFYLMRAISALFVAVLLTLAFRTQWKHFKTIRSIVAMFVIVIPTILAFGGSINPFALEAATATLFWVSGLCLAHPNSNSVSVKNLK